VGKSASEIGQELEQTRSDAAEKIEKIEQQVTQSAESVKESLDWRHQVEQRPLMALGTAFLSGLMLGELTNGDQHKAPQYSYNGASGNAYQTRGSSSQGGMTDAVRHAARASGADDAISSAAAALLSTAGQRIKDVIDETYPGFLERYERSKTASGGVSERIRAASDEEMSSSGADQAVA
jgi:hypothetical protein